MAKPGKMYEYYQTQPILPTTANLKSLESFRRYEDQRKDLVTEKLNIPIQFFQDREILEFGPDSGENALVFAKWGAKLHLVEPNSQAIETSKKNFEQFNFTDAIQSIAQTDIDGYTSKKKFDFIVAEGFVHSIKPDKSWISKFSTLSSPNGLVLISYTNTYGAYMELLYSLIAIYIKRKTKSISEYNAILKEIFKTKWNSVNHTRSFESWQMDVIDSPYNSRMYYTINPEKLLKTAFQHGFTLYSSWPSYKNKNDIYWHKHCKSEEEKLALSIEQIQKDQLSFFLGEKLACSFDHKKINEQLHLLLKMMDTWKKNFSSGYSQKTLLAIHDLLTTFKKAKIDAKNSAKITCIQTICKYICDDSTKKLISFCNKNETFINHWGMPTHIVVLKKTRL